LGEKGKKRSKKPHGTPWFIQKPTLLERGPLVGLEGNEKGPPKKRWRKEAEEKKKNTTNGGVDLLARYSATGVKVHYGGSEPKRMGNHCPHDARLKGGGGKGNEERKTKGRRSDVPKKHSLHSCGLSSTKREGGVQVGHVRLRPREKKGDPTSK